MQCHQQAFERPCQKFKGQTLAKVQATGVSKKCIGMHVCMYLYYNIDSCGTAGSVGAWALAA